MEKYSISNKKIKNLLSDISAGVMAIPEMQRPFVWENTAVRDLLDSLYQGFPVGYLVEWQNPNVRLKDGSTSIGKRVLIDGQQRITALAAAIVGKQVLDKHYKWRPIVIAFNPLEQIFEVASPANQKSPEWIPNISKVFDPSFNTYAFVKQFGMPILNNG